MDPYKFDAWRRRIGLEIQSKTKQSRIMPLIFSRKHRNYSKFSDRVYIQKNCVLYLIGIIKNVEIKMIKRKRQNIRGKTSPLKSTQESCNSSLYYCSLIKEFLWEKFSV